MSKLKKAIANFKSGKGLAMPIFDAAIEAMIETSEQAAAIVPINPYTISTEQMNELLARYGAATPIGDIPEFRAFFETQAQLFRQHLTNERGD